MDSELIYTLLTDYDTFTEIALRLEWAEAACESYDLSPRYPIGCMVQVIRFRAGDMQAHFAERFVQAVLMRIADSNEWQPDFWQIPIEERRECLTKGEQLYRNELSYREVRLQPVSGQALWERIQGDAGERVRALPHDLRGLIVQGQSIELGGTWELDHDVMTVTSDALIFTNYGIWD